jgi:hypothetical protein
MKKTICLSILIAAFTAALILVAPKSATAHTVDEPFRTDLIAGQHTDAGDVLVWNDTNNLYVRYVTEGGWCITEMHLDVAASLEDIPQKNGNPIPGHFEYSKSSRSCVQEETFTIPINPDWFNSCSLYIAAHAVVRNSGQNGNGKGRTETAWGAGSDFPGKNWATYFNYNLQTIERYPEVGNAYVGIEDWINGDFDYNDFGMNFELAEEYTQGCTTAGEATQFLTSVTVTTTAVIYDSGMDHLIHIRRPLNGSYSYQVSRSVPADPNELTLWDGATGRETPSGAFMGSGDLDVTLYNTSKYTWPQKEIGESVVFKVTLDDPSANPKVPVEPPRSFTVDSTTFFDLPAILGNYDLWFEGTLFEARFHLKDTEIITNTSQQKNTPAIIPLDTKVPFVLVVPFTNWIPPFEDTTITSPYGRFDDFYLTASPDNWFLPAMVTNNCVGPGGLSFGPYLDLPDLPPFGPPCQ